MTGLTGNNAITGAGYRKNQPPYEIDQSLRFEDGDSAKLTWTPGSAGSLKKFTISVWVKRGNLSDGVVIGAGNYSEIKFTSDILQVQVGPTNSTACAIQTSAVYRDTSAWYHIVVAADTTQASASNRLKLYVNGEEVTAFSLDQRSLISQDVNLTFTGAYEHRIGVDESSAYFDGYIAEVNLIDGQALTPASFGETFASTNQWVPIAYEGSYGTNGFYLDFSRGTGYTQFTSTGSNTWTCPAGVTSIDVLAVAGGGGGGRNSLQGGGGGAGGLVYAENYSVTPGVEYDITIGAGGAGTTGTGTNGANGSNTVFNVNAEGGGATITAIGGGGGAGYHEGSDGGSGGGGQPVRNGGNATQGDSGGGTGYGNNGAAGYTGGGTDDHGGGGGGAGAAGTAAVTNKAGNGGIGRYYGYRFGDSVGDSGYFAGGGGGGTRQQISAIGIGGSGGGGNGQFNGEGNEDGQANTGGGGGGGSANDSGGDGGSGTVILVPSSVSFIGSDSSGNGNNFTATNITATDELLDSPTNNFATLNPLVSTIPTLSEGNLKGASTSTSTVSDTAATFSPTSGKWYWEICLNQLNLDNSTGYVQFNIGGGAYIWSYYNTPTTQIVANTTTAISNFSAGDILQFAVDIDNGKAWFGNNGTWYTTSGTPNPSAGTGQAYTFTYSGDFWSVGMARFQMRSGSGTQIATCNFGQDSSFAGTKTAQNNTDGNGIGDFYYTPPTGFVALCSDNLPDPSIADPTAYFNTLLYTADGTAGRSITGVGFAPDFVWAKERNAVAHHVLVDSVRGTSSGGRLSSNRTNAEDGTGGVAIGSFDSDGFTVGSSASYLNSSTTNYVAWNWKAGGTASTNEDGSIDSSVSANTTAGFSIVAWTGTGSNVTVGHGLSQAPELIINKSRGDAYNWAVQSILFNSASDTNLLYLNTTAAAADDTNVFQAAPTATVFSPQGGSWAGIGANTIQYIAYCFHSVDGYSKVGSYTGNSNADGPMFYCGFKPSWAMFKATGSAQSWTVFDNKRNVYNLMDNSLFPDLNNVENDATSLSIDFVSNGIKIRSAHNYVNYSGSDYLVLAFAESPFKTSNAR